MGCEWVWLDSDQDYPNDSELSNDYRSLFSSWDSSLDLDVGSWRQTEDPDPEAEELEESSSPGREPSELLVGDGESEESQEGAEQVSQQSLLHFLSEVAYLMEPLCISSKASNENCCLPSGTRQQERRQIETTEGEEGSCTVTRELSTKVDPLVAEKKLLREYEKTEVALVPSDACASQELPTESEEGEAQQDSREEDQGEECASDMEDQPTSGVYADGISTQETPLVEILYSYANASRLTALSQGDPIQDHFLFKKTLLQVWKMIASHRFSSPFLKPVSERQAPGYKDVVKRPMDLTTLKRNLSKGRIRTMAEFQRDLMLMFQNAVMYNDSDHHIYHMAVEMQREVLEQMQIYVEQTLAIIKPDIVDKEEEIHDIILRSGFTIVQRRKLHLSPEHCSNFYVEQYGKMFFPNLTAYMSSGPLIAMILARHNAISYWKELLGPTNSLLAKETHPDSLRAIYGTDDLRNALHGSNDFAAAEREIRFMFPKVIIEPIPIGQAAKDYLNLYVIPTLLEGLTELCKQKPADPLIWLADWLLRNNPNKPKLHLYSVAPEPLVPPDQE